MYQVALHKRNWPIDLCPCVTLCKESECNKKSKDIEEKPRAQWNLCIWHAFRHIPLFPLNDRFFQVNGNCKRVYEMFGKRSLTWIKSSCCRRGQTQKQCIMCRLSGNISLSAWSMFQGKSIFVKACFTNSLPLMLSYKWEFRPLLLDWTEFWQAEQVYYQQ